MKPKLRQVATLMVGAIVSLCATLTAGAQTPFRLSSRMELPAYNRVGEKVIPVSRPRETCFPTPRERVDGLQYPWWRQNFALTSADIRQIDLDGLKKIIGHDAKDTRPLLINFWATWCDGCREEFPELVKIDNDYRGKGLNFISISLDDVADINTKVTGFLKEVHAGMPVVVLNVNDPEPAIHFVDPTWQGEMPATFLYDHDGKIVFKYFGKIKPAELRAAIDKQISPQQ